MIVPVQIGRDTPSDSWGAIWIASAATDGEQDRAKRLGVPVTYWSAAVGWPGEWVWPDGSRTAVMVSPPIVVREPGGAYRVSADGGLTFGLLPLSAGQLQAIERLEQLTQPSSSPGTAEPAQPKTGTTPLRVADAIALTTGLVVALSLLFMSGTKGRRR